MYLVDVGSKCITTKTNPFQPNPLHTCMTPYIVLAIRHTDVYGCMTGSWMTWVCGKVDWWVDVQENAMKLHHIKGKLVDQIICLIRLMFMLTLLGFSRYIFLIVFLLAFGFKMSLFFSKLDFSVMIYKNRYSYIE